MGQYSFKLPDVGEGTAEAEIAEWRVKVGDRVEEDQPLVDMMTDKATVELTSPVAGVVQSIAGRAGEKAAVGSVLVVLETAGDASADQNKQTAAAEQPAAVAAQAGAEQRRTGTGPVALASGAAHAPSRSADLGSGAGHGASRSDDSSAYAVAGFSRAHEAGTQPRRGERPAASPAVRRRAEELGIKLQFVRGTGPTGRILHADLDAYLADETGAGGPSRIGQAEPAQGGGNNYLYTKLAGGEDIPVIGLRRQIAERMQAAKRHIPHFTYVEEVDVTELEELRAHLNATRAKDQPKLTLLPFLMRALVRVLREFPQMNATYDDEAGVIHRSAPVHIGMAVQTTRGLLVAVIKHAESRDLWDCASEVGQLATVTRDGKASREQLTGSTITITSLGPLGGVSATPVINRPEVAIIGPNKIVERPVVRDGQIVIRKMMNLSSSFDHRVIDGAEAAEFIQRLRAVLEQPATIFVR
ncbi:dihydrolipoamide acetyltransferase family protein [Peristeroidobacter agariperforans]|uniref:dihydrolipoamide acetyltransferase family protein n=1 Tax=Peristeroidobacter agariperforans TaxID=268404 RepID=UPI00101DB697|nr:dihydrolipoamide acetyltransferase family protein [Peristeroidobacter agariperforans]